MVSHGGLDGYTFGGKINSLAERLYASSDSVTFVVKSQLHLLSEMKF